MNKKILIVDDDPDMRLGLHVRLKANHFDTCFAADAMTAIRAQSQRLSGFHSGACSFGPPPIPQSRACPKGWSKSVLSKARQ